jgi:Holliday junction resolvasome RuvABC endonuclease subunit
VLTLGFDPSLTGFGWCIHDSEATGTDRIVARGRWATSSKTFFVLRYTEFRANIDTLLREHPEIEAVGVESPVFGELWSPGLYALFVYTNEIVYTHQKPVVFFDPGTVKLLAKIDPKVRKGKMFKTDMVNAAKADVPGFKGRLNHNEADAYHVARFAARFFLLVYEEITDDDLTPSERHSFSRIHTFTKGKRRGQTVRSGTRFKENRFFIPGRMNAAIVANSSLKATATVKS